MALYCIGDIHGCYKEFMSMLDLIHFDEKKDELILTGDLIGRGPLPLETMRFVLQLHNKGRVHSVIGNHDLNFLCVHYGLHPARAKDNLEPLLNCPEREEIVDFFERCPLLYLDKPHQLAVAHAGIYPLWSLKKARKMSDRVEKVMRNPLYRHLLLANMYSNEPHLYSDDLKGLPLWRFALNSYTRMRLCFKDGSLDFDNSAVSPEQVRNLGMLPWFDLTNPYHLKKKPYTLVFGHWAALGAKCYVPYIRALDTGSVWRDRLTARCCDSDMTYHVKSVGYIEIFKPKPQN